MKASQWTVAASRLELVVNRWSEGMGNASKLCSSSPNHLQLVMEIHVDSV
jgi:hypothetical protein